MSKNALCPLIQNPLTLMSDLVSSDWFLLISSPDNGCKAGSTLTSLVNYSSMSAMLSLNSLDLRVRNPLFLRCTLYGLEQTQWLGNLFNGSPYLKCTASQKFEKKVNQNNMEFLRYFDFALSTEHWIDLDPKCFVYWKFSSILQLSQTLQLHFVSCNFKKK